ncbi:MAG: hypothetical protein Q4D96_09310 [Propionibacteriaceae bacterium]|nr:hypothetical protein [Propionibacteriaceae bacterium]
MVHVDLGDLRLDLDNYRIPTRPDDEAAALQYLFASEDALEAATSILRDGYFDNEVPVVLETSLGSKQYLVLEGNRRVSALKALQDPGVAGVQQQAVERLLKRFASEVANLPVRIRVLVAPDRKTAEPHIARLHTTTSKKKWSRDQQATFYYSLLDASTTVADIKARHPGVKNIPAFIKMAVMRRFLNGVRFDDPSLHDYAVSNDLPMSSFEYAYKRPEIAEALGVSFTKDGLLEPTTETPEAIGAGLSEQHRRAVEYLIGEFRAERLNTRSDALKASRPELVKQLVARMTGRPPAPPPPPDPNDGGNKASTSSSGGGGSSPGSFSDQRGDGAESSQTSGGGVGSRGPNRPETKDKLDLRTLDYEQLPPALEGRYFELRRLSVQEFPITTAILLRSILETTVKYYLETTGVSASGALKPMLQELRKAEGNNKAWMTCVNQVDSGGSETPGAVAWFNVVAHSPDRPVFPEEVHKAWKLVEPLLRRLLDGVGGGR